MCVLCGCLLCVDSFVVGLGRVFVLSIDCVLCVFFVFRLCVVLVCVVCLFV